MKTDPIVERVRKRLLDRSQAGIKKYGTTLADNNLSELEWHYHHLDELLDAANYVMRKIESLEKEEKDCSFCGGRGFVGIHCPRCNRMLCESITFLKM